jgi:hypothetical protein
LYAAIGNRDYTTETDRISYEQTFKIRQLHRRTRRLAANRNRLTEGDAWLDTRSSETMAWLGEPARSTGASRDCLYFPLGADVQMRPLNADDVLARFFEFNLGAVFCGHFHGYTERRLGDALITTDRCCARVRANHDGSKEKGWFVCRATASGQVTREFIEFKEFV